MTSNSFQSVVADRLEHLVQRVEALTAQGRYADAAVLRAEGLNLAEAFDREDTFLVLGAVSA